jgi:hypothetical protein
MRYRELIEATVRAYHGSSNPAQAFVLGHTGENSHTFGHYQSQRWGVFFTDHPEFAKIYGQVGAYDLNLQHTLDFKADRGEVIYQFIKTLDAFSQDERPIWMDAKNVLHGDWSYWHLFENELGKRFVAYFKEQGYDSATFEEYNEDDHGEEHRSQTIVVLDPSLIKPVSR